MCENPQYDHQLGGNRILPSSIRLMQFAAARCKEIQTMKQSLSSKGGGKLVFQKLPTHMRRRVMSHNAKRLPRRLREIHMNQLKKSGLGVKQKRPPRKYRRRPQNLMADYVQRQRKYKWLETHIWHAKRFYMIEQWGYKLPQSPCDKAFRACYRATAKHCLLEDISYIGCIEVNAKETSIIDAFAKICDKNVNNMSIGAKAFINGNREGKLTLISSGIPMGDVNFQWVPQKNNDLNRTLWIWVHASFFNSVLNTLISIFHLKLKKNGTSLGKHYENKKNSISVYDLRFDLSRFRLTGPLAHAVLQNSLMPPELCDNTSDLFVKTFLNDDQSRKTSANQAGFWKSIKNISSAGELSPHIILGLTALDPRYNMPKKRAKALNDNSKTPSSKEIEAFPTNLSWSPLYDKSVRAFVKVNKLSNSDFCEIRSNLLVPGTELGSHKMSVPYLLIQRPGNKNDNLGYCSGWDLIIPSGWAQPTWLAFIMWGARAGGLREAESNIFEMGMPAYLKPDTPAGIENEQRISQLYRRRYFSLPPNKRVNYTKLSIVSPFQCKWKVLLEDWNCFPDKKKRFYVLRDKRLLQVLQDNMTKKTLSKEIVNFQVPYIVPVRLVLHKKGNPGKYSIICLPKQQDLQRSCKEVIEPPKADDNQAERIRRRLAHKELLKKLKRYRKRCRLTGKRTIQKTNFIEKYKKTMSDLWLPDIQSQIRTSSSREVVGWVTKGDFSFTVGKNVAVGYVVMGCLPAFFSSTMKNKVLVRSTTSRQYRIATMEIIV